MHLNKIKIALIFATIASLVTPYFIVAAPPAESNLYDDVFYDKQPTTKYDEQNIPNFINFIRDAFPGSDSKNVAGSSQSSNQQQLGKNNGDLTQYIYNFPADDQLRMYGSAIPNNPALNDIFNEAASHVGVPAKLLKAIAARECPTVFNLTSEEVVRFSTPGGEIPFCRNADPPNYSNGIMQFLPSTWPAYSSSVNEFGGYTHTPSVHNIRDSVYAGAKLILRATPISDSSRTSGIWTYQDVVNAVACYNAGRCARNGININYDDLSKGTRSYVDSVWQYYGSN